MIIWFLRGDNEREASVIWNGMQHALLSRQVNLIHQTILNTLFQYMWRKQTYLRRKYVIIVSANPAIDIPHPIHVITESPCDICLVWDISNSKAKFVKCVHVQVVKPSYSCDFKTVHPSSDHEPATPGTEVTKYIFKTSLMQTKQILNIKQPFSKFIAKFKVLDGAVSYAET